MFAKKSLLCMSVFLALAHSAVAFAANDKPFKLEFTLSIDSNDQTQFPKGYPAEGAIAVLPPYYHYLRVNVSSIAEKISEKKVRFKFIEPLEIETRQKDKTSTVVFRQMDVELAPDQIAMFDILRAHRFTDLFVNESEVLGKTVTIEDAIAKAESLPSLMPLVQELHDMPDLLMYQGDISLVGAISLSDFQSGTMKVNISERMNLRRVEKFDTSISKVYLDSSLISIGASKVLEMPVISITEPQVKKYLDIQSKLKELNRKALGFGIGSFTDTDGLQKIAIIEPKRDANVARPSFGSKKTCKDLFTERD